MSAPDGTVETKHQSFSDATAAVASVRAETIDSGEIPDEGEGSGGHETPGHRFLWLQAIAFLFGLALFAFLINLVGVEPIFLALSSIGFGFFALVFIIGARHVFRTLAMIVAVPPEHRKVTFRQAFAARLGGESVTFLTFTGPLLGEATKAALLRNRVPFAYGVQAIVIDNLLYNLSVALFVLSGACVMLAVYPLPRVIQYVIAGIAVSAALGLSAVAYAVSRRLMPLTLLIDVMGRVGLGHKIVYRRREHVRRLEASVYEFYKHRRVAFFSMLGLDFLAHATSVVEVYVALRLLGFDSQLAASYIIESLMKVINFAFGFVPGTIGVYEGGTEVILRALGFVAATGVTLALARKAGIIFWTIMGLLVLAWRTVPSAVRRIIERHPHLEKAMDNLVFSNIAHRPARTFVSVLGIGVGVLLIVFTTGLAHGVLRERGRREASVNAELMVRPSGTVGLGGSQMLMLDVRLAEEISRLEGVRAAVPLGQNIVSSSSGFGQRLIDGIPFEQYAGLANLQIVEGRGLSTTGDEAIVDTTWKTQQRAEIGHTIQLYERPFRIVGVYDPPGGGRIKIPLQTMQEQAGSENRASSILVACTNPAEQETVAQRINERFPDQQIIFTRDLPELYATGTPALNVFINVVVGVAAAISLLVVLLAMYTTVTERTRQIGILKSLGMSNKMIAWIIEQEAILISVLGVGLGLVLTYVARFAVMRATLLNIEIEWRWVTIALLIGLLGGTLGALYPALRAARQDAVKALSYE